MTNTKAEKEQSTLMKKNKIDINTQKLSLFS